MTFVRPTLAILACCLLLGCGPTKGPDDEVVPSGGGVPSTDGPSTETGRGFDAAPDVLNQPPADAGSDTSPADGGRDNGPSLGDAGGDRADAGSLPDASSLDATVRMDSSADLGPALDAPVDAPEPTDSRPADVAPDAPLDTVADSRPTDVSGTSGLLAYYACDRNVGGLLLDESGNGRSATLMAPVSFAAGALGNAVVLGRTQATDAGTQYGYVALPANLLSAVDDMTIAVWIRLNNNPSWNRVFDFGTGTKTYMFLTPNNQSARLRFAISRNGQSGEQALEGPGLATDTWYHLAVVLDADGGHLFVNGAEVATNASLTLRPSALGLTPNNWLGRSQFSADAYFEGSVAELRLYNRALSRSEIQALAAP